MIDLNNKRIVISRTDSIGDVMLTLPLCAWIKENFSNVQVIFLGNNYTKPVVECFSSVDQFADWKETENYSEKQKIDFLKSLNADVIVHVFPNKELARFSKKAKIEIRVGTSHRIFHFLTCTEKVNFTRKKSPLHESQLNFELLRPFGLKTIPSLEEINEYTRLFYSTNEALPEFIQKKLDSSDKTVILHAKSQGSAVEWGLENYRLLALKLEKRGYTVFFTGTENEGILIRDQIHFSSSIIDTTGKLTLAQLIHLISKCKSLVACSTGPFHIAGFLAIHAVGLFSPRKPIHPGRWKALGPDVQIVVNDEQCPTCQKGKICKCIELIPVDRVLNELI
jgi:ADP-heptose:LPS heptosyltransferase